MNELVDKIEELVRRLVEAEEMRDHYHRQWLDTVALLEKERKERNGGMNIALLGEKK